MRCLTLTIVLLSMIAGTAHAQTATPSPTPAPSPAPDTWKLKKPQVEIYGYIKLDSSYDTSRTDNGNYARWVNSEASNSDDDQFNMTPNESRLGLTLKGPDEEGIEATGKVEADFYGGGAENKSQPMLRHAYLQLRWTDYDVSLLAGQTSDLMSPLFPQTVNYTVGWWVGNIGYRRAQIRLTKNLPVADSSKFIFAVAAARTIGDQNEFGPGDTGEDSGLPTAQYRAAFSTPGAADKPMEIGVSGHWGQEEYDVDETGASEDYDTWSVNGDLTVPITGALSLKGEIFYGDNLDTFLGGVGQGVNVPLNQEIAAFGGWGALNFQATDVLAFNLGSTVDNPSDGDLADGSRTQNLSVFGNAYYKITSAITTALEVGYWETKYKAEEKADSIRTQLAFIYYF